jgi:hypothetical protein
MEARPVDEEQCRRAAEQLRDSLDGYLSSTRQLTGGIPSYDHVLASLGEAATDVSTRSRNSERGPHRQMVALSATSTLSVTDEKRLFDLVEERRRKTGSSLSSDHGQHRHVVSAVSALLEMDGWEPGEYNERAIRCVDQFLSLDP